MYDVAPAVVQYLARLKPGGSRSTAACRVKNLAEIMAPGVHPVDFPWHELRPEEIAVLRVELQRRYAPQTANGHLLVLRGVLRSCWRSGLLDADAYERLVDFRPIRGGSVRQGRSLTMEELGRLVGVARRREGPLGLRNLAILAVLIEGGLRKSEVSGLQLEHYSKGSLQVVRSKHGRTRVVPLDRARAALERWLGVRGSAPGALFCVQRDRLRAQEGDVPCRALSPDMVDQIVKGFLREAGLEDVTLHDLRRTMISTLLARGNDLAVAARLAGHASPRTTLIYDKRPQEAAEAAVRTLEMPL